MESATGCGSGSTVFIACLCEYENALEDLCESTVVPDNITAVSKWRFDFDHVIQIKLCVSVPIEVLDVDMLAG